MAPDWLAAARSDALRGPRAPRVPLWVDDVEVGSVEPQVLERVALQDADAALVRMVDGAWQLRTGTQGRTDALNALARALREHGLCGPWRDEQLAVWDQAGERVATIERGAVRVLGIATRAVHLVGLSHDGRMWVQQRAFSKPNNPGMWDTIMGGMVSAADSLQTALERETWEEAGLRIADLSDVVQGGLVEFSQPSEEAGGTGYMYERIDWFSARLPPGLEPRNQDGEVERFELITLDEVQQRLAQGAFTPEAALVLAGFFRW